jgi:cytochrome c oxidase subunit 1
MLFCIGFLVTFLLGGLTGVLLASPPIDFHVTTPTSSWRTSTTSSSAPRCSPSSPAPTTGSRSSPGRMMDDRLGKVHFWTLFFGFHLTFLGAALARRRGHAAPLRRLPPSDGFTTLNTVSSIGAFVLGASTLPFIYNVWVSFKRGERAPGDDPWGFGNSLEWATSCPPPRHNFVTIPRIRSERPGRSTSTTRRPSARPTSTPRPRRR